MNLTPIKSMSSLQSMNSMSVGKPFKQNSMAGSAHAEREQARVDKVNSMKSLLRDANSSNKNQNRPTSILESTRNYGEQIRSSRTSSKGTSNELKKLKYNFKNISSQIRKAKTSVNAKQVASKARREVIQLKAKLQTGKYDEDELSAAIEHAKSMERAAKKKARHLEEEELIKISDKSVGAGLSASELEQKLEDETEKAIEDYEAELEAEKEEEMEAISEEQVAEMERAMEESIAEVQQMMEESMEESMEEVTEDMYDLLAESMEDMMEETLENLMDGMMVVTDYEMTDDEFKAYKLKHRTSEDKSMLEADAKYLKAIFDMYDKKMGSGSGSPSVNTGMQAAFAPVSMPISSDVSMNIQSIVDVSV